ncbi:MAG: hypothetical protein A2X36_15935 [Elusimicrobia bacterium GWA2_69_24]|nr:MAG: hypothetical protein A2X36_15935 [Elusimicrobia bacterium GWA2_69_24]HBL16594.1 esterase [Elusimicrobiota bacterium]
MNGRIIQETVGSVALKGNPLGDPRLREIPVYLPASYAQATEKRYPVVFFLTGFSGTPDGIVHAHPWKESLIAKLDRLIASRKVDECILVIPDCFTRYGGSQYVNSPGTGRYEDHIVSELVGYIDAKYRTLARAEGRAVMGKSSGGFGALHLGMRHPDVFSHVVCHSGDVFFEMCCLPEAPKCVNALSKFGGSFARFLKAFDAARDKNALPHELILLAAMASCYSPNPRSPLGFDLPFDEETGEVIPKVWERWLAFDPVRLAPRRVKDLKKLKTLFFDCGSKDEYHLHLGARKFARVLRTLGVPHVYEEHGRGHFDMNERYERGLVVLSAAFRRSAGCP